MILAVGPTPASGSGVLGFIDQSPTLSAIVGGLVVVALVALVALLSRVPRLKPIYTAAGRGITRFFRWLASLRVNGAVRRASIKNAGYDERDSEIVAERAVVAQPSWKVDARDGLGERNLHWLENYGYEVFDVGLACDAEFFLLDAEVFWQGGFGSNQPGGYIGKFFKGVATERGQAKGVIFHVKWRDRNDDTHERDVLFPPQEIRAGKDEALAEEWAKGRAVGRAEVFAEDRPALPPPDPRWNFVDEGKGEDGISTYRVINLMPGSVVFNARVEVSQKGLFHFSDPAFWPDLAGESEGLFRGHITNSGDYEGFTFTLHWLDQGHDAQSESWRVAPTKWPEEPPF